MTTSKKFSEHPFFVKLNTFQGFSFLVRPLYHFILRQRKEKWKEVKGIWYFMDLAHCHEMRQQVSNKWEKYYNLTFSIKRRKNDNNEIKQSTFTVNENIIRHHHRYFHCHNNFTKIFWILVWHTASFSLQSLCAVVCPTDCKSVCAVVNTQVNLRDRHCVLTIRL